MTRIDSVTGNFHVALINPSTARNQGEKLLKEIQFITDTEGEQTLSLKEFEHGVFVNEKL